MFRAEARAVKLLENDPTPDIHYFIAETGGLLEPHELQTRCLLHAAPQPYSLEPFEDSHNRTVKWNRVPIFLRAHTAPSDRYLHGPSPGIIAESESLARHNDEHPKPR